METMQLTKYDAARHALQVATSVDEVKDIRDRAQAMSAYARQANDTKLVEWATEIKVRAERRAGEMLSEMPKNKGAATRSYRATALTLNDIGVSKDQSSRWQKLASIPEEKFEEAVLAAKQGAGEVTTNSMLVLAASEQEILKKAKDIRSVRSTKLREKRINKIVEISKGSAPLGQIAERFPIIYCDPPWRYEHIETESRAIENQYPTMSLEEIKALPIDEVCMEDCVLFMWATSPKLAESLEVLEAWGFSYRTCAVWDKQKIGMGYYFRQQHELLLVAIRGNPPAPLPANRPASVFTYPRGKHSTKPVEVYELINSMYSELPKLEMFCRKPREGWGAWGNQAEAA